LQLLQTNFVGYGFSHYFTRLVMIVPPGAPSGLEILYLPFQASLWMLILCSFLVETAIVFILNQRYKSCNKHSYMHIYIVFVGAAVSSTPKNLIGRYSLFLWIYFCFILRNLYQAKLYDDMRLMQNKSHVMSYEAAIEEDFFFFIGKDFGYVFDSMPKVLERWVVVQI
jgi:hypothetical protein